MKPSPAFVPRVWSMAGPVPTLWVPELSRDQSNLSCPEWSCVKPQMDGASKLQDVAAVLGIGVVAPAMEIIAKMGRVKQIWYLSPMRAVKVQASLRIRAVSPEPPLLNHTSIEWRGTFRQTARSLAPLNGWACAVKVCHDGMLEDTNSLDGAQIQTIQKPNKLLE